MPQNYHLFLFPKKQLHIFAPIFIKRNCHEEIILLLVSLCALAMSSAFAQNEKQSAESVKVVGNGSVSSTFTGTVDYDTYFTSERLRLDFVLAGDRNSQYAFLSELHKESQWAGSPNGLIDPFGYGQYYFEAFADGKLIYSKGFCTLFEEWRATEQAKNVAMAVNQTIWMPFPKQTIHVVLYQRIKRREC